MAIYTVKLKAKEWKSVDQNSPPSPVPSSLAYVYRQLANQSTDIAFARKMLIRFETIADEYKNKLLRDVRLVVESKVYSARTEGSMKSGTSFASVFTWKAIASQWSTGSVSWYNMPSASRDILSFETMDANVRVTTASRSQLESAGIDNIYNNGILIELGIAIKSGGFASPSLFGVFIAYEDIYVPNGVYLELTYEDAEVWVTDLSPISGMTIDASASNTFSWRFNATEGLANPPRQESFLFQWRVGSTGTINEIVGGTDNRVTVPADVMPVNQEIQWRVKLSANSPGLETIWSNWITLTPLDRTPKILIPAPQSGFIDDSRSNDFSWDLGVVGAKPGRMPKQIAFEYQWRRESTGIVSPIAGGSAMALTIPANTFPAQEPFSWRVRAKSDDNLWTDWTSWFALTTVPIAGSAYAISPRGQFIRGGEPILFVWQHAGPSGLPQSAWEIQIRAAGSETWTVAASGSGVAQQYTLSAYSLLSGVFYWRVRTRDSLLAWGNWSEELENYLRTPPAAPTVNEVPNATRPLVSWQAPEQLGYQLQIRDPDGNILYDSGIVAGEGRQHQVADYLKSGRYVFAVRVQNQFGDWSTWGERAVTITLSEIGVPGVRLAALYGGVRVMIDPPVNGAEHIIYRDEGGGPIAIARLADGETLFDDYRCAGACLYFVRATLGNSHGDGVAAKSVPDIRHTLIALTERPHDFVPVWYRRGQRPDKSRETRLNVSLRHFQGRSLPVAEYGEEIDRERTYSYSIIREKDPEGVKKLEKMIASRGAFLVREPNGTKFYGVLASLRVSEHMESDDFSLTFQEIAYKEAITLD